MREKPILFSAPMVQAILDGRKTMTRRIIKPQPDEKYSYCHGICTSSTDNKNVGRVGLGPSNVLVKQFIKPPYQPGDHLYVRETWRIGAWAENPGRISVDYKADGYIRREWLDVEDPERFERYWIQSTHDAEKAGLKFDLDGQYHWEPGKAPTRWRPSIFMPKEAARIWLEVTNVRVERLQDITEEDAVKEGVKAYGPNNCSGTSARIAFAELWDSLNAKRGYGWDGNPFVWVISFKVLEGGKLSA